MAAELQHAFSHWLFWRPALRVLCYHRVHPTNQGPFTITTEQLNAQLGYFSRCGFQFIRASDLLLPRALPERPLLLTFDDGYADSSQYLQPILRHHRATATLFIVTGYVGDCAPWSNEHTKLLSIEQLRELDPELVELALHSHLHRSFGGLSLFEIENDLRKSLAFFAEHRIPVSPALAYPYGCRPKHPIADLAHCLAVLGIRLAFRLGNRINRLPLHNPYEIQRIGVSGEWSQAVFQTKVWLGKVL